MKWPVCTSPPFSHLLLGIRAFIFSLSFTCSTVCLPLCVRLCVFGYLHSDAFGQCRTRGGSVLVLSLFLLLLAHLEQFAQHFHRGPVLLSVRFTAFSQTLPPILWQCHTLPNTLSSARALCERSVCICRRNLREPPSTLRSSVHIARVAVPWLQHTSSAGIEQRRSLSGWPHTCAFAERFARIVHTDCCGIHWPAYPVRRVLYRGPLPSVHTQRVMERALSIPVCE